MSTRESRRQKQLAKRKKKRKEKRSVATTNTTLTTSIRKLAKQSANLPLHDCLVPENLFSGNGLGTFVISRNMNDGNFATSVILLDVFCLGVKDAYFTILSSIEYGDMLDQIVAQESLEPTDPACAKKLVEECVRYAEELGFKAHPDYDSARHIFGDAVASSCKENFTFGQDGKPCYIPGPNDSDSKIKRTLNTLEKTCGEGNYDYVAELQL